MSESHAGLLPPFFLQKVFSPYLCVYLGLWVRAKLLQSCLTLSDPMDHSLPGTSDHGILQAILEWVAMSSSRGSS